MLSVCLAKARGLWWVSRVIGAKVDMLGILPSACRLVVCSWAIHVASGSPLTETAQAASWGCRECLGRSHFLNPSFSSPLEPAGIFVCYSLFVWISCYHFFFSTSSAKHLAEHNGKIVPPLLQSILAHFWNILKVRNVSGGSRSGGGL